MAKEDLELDKQWQSEVWDHLDVEWKEVRILWPESMTEANRNVVVNLTNKKLKDFGGCAGVAINIARLDIGRVSIPGDVLSFSKAVVSGKHYFWNQENDVPQCPDFWPTNRNIPMACLSPDIRGEDVTQYGMDHFILTDSMTLCMILFPILFFSFVLVDFR